MNAKQAFEEAANHCDTWARSKYNAVNPYEGPSDYSRECDAAGDVLVTCSEHFTRRASEVEAEDAAWTEDKAAWANEVRRLALSINDRSRLAGDTLRDARLLATLVLNVVGEKP